MKYGHSRTRSDINRQKFITLHGGWYTLQPEWGWIQIRKPEVSGQILGASAEQVISLAPWVARLRRLSSWRPSGGVFWVIDIMDKIIVARWAQIYSCLELDIEQPLEDRGRNKTLLHLLAVNNFTILSCKYWPFSVIYSTEWEYILV